MTNPAGFYPYVNRTLATLFAIALLWVFQPVLLDFVSTEEQIAARERSERIRALAAYRAITRCQ